MTRLLTRWALRLLSLLLIGALAIGVFTVGKNLGWLSIVGIESESHDSQVIQAVKRTQEVSLLSLSIQGLREEDRNRKIFGKRIPGTSEKVFLQYNFHAKLGIDGAKVTITQTGKSAYLVSVPKFIFIGYAKPTFRVATEDGGVLSFVTPDIDKVEMVNEILNDSAQQKYIAANKKLLKDQTKTFYESLITSIDPAVVATFEFRS